MQDPNSQELIQTRRLPHMEAIELLHSQLKEANHRARLLSEKVAMLELQLIREGWTSSDFNLLYSKE